MKKKPTIVTRIQTAIAKGLKPSSLSQARAVLLTSLLLLVSSAHSNADISIVVRTDNTRALNITEIKRIFLGKWQQFPDGSVATPLVREGGSKEAKQFIKLFLNKTSQQYNAHWARLIFTGKGYPPEEAFSDDEIIDRIMSDPSIISYIRSASLTSDVREVFRITE